MKNIIKSLKESNGFLTKTGRVVNPKEVHAFGIGIYHGITPTKGIPQDVLEENKDVRREPHYAKGGYIIGRTAATGAGVVAGGFIF